MGEPYRSQTAPERLTLEEVVSRLDAFDAEDTIYARQPWSATSECLIESSLSKPVGFPYFLDIPTAREVRDVLEEEDGERDLERELQLLIYYAENDAYPQWVWALDE